MFKSSPIRYTSLTLLAFATWISFCHGGAYLWLVLLLNPFGLILFENTLGHDESNEAYRGKGVLNFLLHFTLPMLVLLHLTAWWLVTPVDQDPFHFGYLIYRLFGFDLIQVKQSMTTAQWVVFVFNLGLINANMSLGVGHELSHRVKNRFSMATGRWLTAFAADAAFSIEHVVGHHAHVATEADPATARRGETVYGFILRSSLGQLQGAWHIEKARCERKHLLFWSLSNQLFRAYLMVGSILCLAYLVGQERAVGLFLITAIIAKSMLEMTNYIQHYGLTRLPKTPIESHHSWNTWVNLTNSVTYNLARHSDHHIEGSKPFYKLRFLENVPTLPYGYLTMIFLTLFPPLFKQIMEPVLRTWDRSFATEGERRLAHRHANEFGWNIF